MQTAQNDRKQSIVPNLCGMAICQPSLRKTTALKVGEDLLKPLIARATNTFKSEMMFYKERLHQYNTSIKKLKD